MAARRLAAASCHALRREVHEKIRAVLSSARSIARLSGAGRRLMSSKAVVPLLVAPSEVQGKSAVFLDASWYMPNSPRNATEEFKHKRLPGARFLDLDQVASSHELGLKHMMPSGSVFAESMAKLGVEPSTHIVLYDTHGVFSAPRALFMLRAFGHENSSVLNGGLPRWESEGLSLEEGAQPHSISQANYPVPSLDDSVIRSYEQVVSNSAKAPAGDDNVDLVLDARSRGRWLGTDPEPRAGMSSGHIPHSFSLPFNTFLKTVETPGGAKYTVFRSKDELDKELRDVLGPMTDAVLRGERRVVNSCGSGMTAAVLWLGLKLLGVEKSALYDESWTGYAMREGSVIEKAT